MLRGKPQNKIGSRPDHMHDWYVKVPHDFSLDKVLDNRSQCRAYKAYIKTLGLNAKIYKRKYTGNKYEGGYIESEELVS